MEADRLEQIHNLYRKLGIDFFTGKEEDEVGFIDDISWFLGKTMNLAAVDLELPKGREKQWHLDKILGSDPEYANRLIFTCRDSVSSSKLSFMLIEDESDGYRSALQRVVVHTRYVPRNVFDCVPVQFVKAGSADDNLIAASVIGTGKHVLEFGTVNVGDYYPSFVGDFQLMNLPANVLRAKEGSERIAKSVEQQRRQQKMESARKHLGWGEF